MADSVRLGLVSRQVVEGPARGHLSQKWGVVGPKKPCVPASGETKSGRSGMRALSPVVLKDANIATKTPMPNRLLEYVTMLTLVNLAELETNSYGSDGPPKT